jgi:hypothetical protein
LVPRYLVTTQRALRGRVPSAREVVSDLPNVNVIDGRDSEMVLIETSEGSAENLKKRLAATHYVDPETRHGLH